MRSFREAGIGVVGGVEEMDAGEVVEVVEVVVGEVECMDIVIFINIQADSVMDKVTEWEEEWEDGGWEVEDMDKVTEWEEE